MTTIFADNTEVEPSSEQISALSSALEQNGYSDLATTVHQLQNSQRPLVVCVLKTDTAPTSVPQAYLKLQLLSHRLVKPHGTDLSGIFGVLKNVAWTNEGAIDIDELPSKALEARLAGRSLSVECVDKFPKWSTTWCPQAYVLPIPPELD